MVRVTIRGKRIKYLGKIRVKRIILVMLSMTILASCSDPVSVKKLDYKPTLDNLLPQPSSVTKKPEFFTLTDSTNIYVRSNNPEAMETGRYLANKLRTSTGFEIRVLKTIGHPPGGNIILVTDKEISSPVDEGYKLEVNNRYVLLEAGESVGLFRGVQTIRQLLPPEIEASQVRPGPWKMAAGIIEDYPYLSWRGSMLDVARHFFTVEEVKRYIDLMAYYKMNRFHFHLTDDQGWRIMINSWPKLATYGGSTEVGGGEGGYYTQDEYAEIVAYARQRHIIVIPEIDMPGHTHAALASYSKLNCDGEAPPLYTGIEVGFSSLCIEKEITYEFADDVIREVAALTPGPYFHIGGDETLSLSDSSYAAFIGKARQIIHSYGKRMVGWEEIGKAPIGSSSLAQHWSSHQIKKAVNQGAGAIMSPAFRTYLDMKYNRTTSLGLEWAGYISVKDAYTWKPDKLIDGITNPEIVGMEAPIWTETLANMDEIEFMAFPRLIGYAEIGWTKPEDRDWTNYKFRLGNHGLRLEQLSVNFYRSSLIPWE